MNDIDPNKIIPAFTDCKGTCKTPIGCTCGKHGEDEEDSHLVIKASDVLAVETSASVKTIVPVVDSKVCSCGKNPGGACGCKTGGGCSSKSNGGGCGCSSGGSGGCCAGKNKLEVYNWMEDMPETIEDAKMIEVQFKNTRKGYYLNSTDIEVYKGDIVAVEASPGHDIGEVTLTGKLVQLQMLKNNYRGETKRLYRIAKPNDIEKYEEAKKKEHKTMLRAREIAEELGLAMKISDVEYQGDGNKSIFYYIADERVDFRQLIKVYASEFRVKIEMKQIGARQEAGRVGGIGPCGRELCCSSSMSNFVSVSTSAARLQDIPLNPQKLAGQCGKLKCCLNFEVDVYVEAQRKLPSREIPLETKDSTYYHFKTDILSGTMTYSTDKHFAANLVALPKDRVHEVIRMNKRGSKPQILKIEEEVVSEDTAVKDILEDSINRFDSDDKSSGRNNRRRNGGRDDNRGGNNNRRGVRNGNDRGERKDKETESAQSNGPRLLNRREAKPENKEGGERPNTNRRPNRPNNGESKSIDKENKAPRENREPRPPREPRENNAPQNARPEGVEGENKPNRNPRRNNRNRRRPSGNDNPNGDANGNKSEE